MKFYSHSGIDGIGSIERTLRLVFAANISTEFDLHVQIIQYRTTTNELGFRIGLQENLDRPIHAFLIRTSKFFAELHCS